MKRSEPCARPLQRSQTKPQHRFFRKDLSCNSQSSICQERINKMTIKIATKKMNRSNSILSFCKIKQHQMEYLFKCLSNLSLKVQQDAKINPRTKNRISNKNQKTYSLSGKHTGIVKTTRLILLLEKNRSIICRRTISNTNYALGTYQYDFQRNDKQSQARLTKKLCTKSQKQWAQASAVSAGTQAVSAKLRIVQVAA